jgi:hypothetical protein
LRKDRSVCAREHGDDLIKILVECNALLIVRDRDDKLVCRVTVDYTETIDNCLLDVKPKALYVNHACKSPYLEHTHQKRQGGYSPLPL